MACRSRPLADVHLGVVLWHAAHAKQGSFTSLSSTRREDLGGSSEGSGRGPEGWPTHRMESEGPRKDVRGRRQTVVTQEQTSSSPNKPARSGKSLPSTVARRNPSVPQVPSSRTWRGILDLSDGKCRAENFCST